MKDTLICPRCLSDKTQKRGRKIYCNECKRFSPTAKSLEIMFPKNKATYRKYFQGVEAPKVLVFDIETLPIIGTFWRTGKQYIGHDNIMEDWIVLSWSAKYLFEPEVFGDILNQGEIQKRLKSLISIDHKPHYADHRIVKRMWELLDKADVVITQNGKKFDAKKLNTRFLYHGLPPPHPYHHIDTLEAANAAFSASSHSLAYMMRFLGLPRKMDTDYSLWLGCQFGDADSLQRMYEYGLNDTWILEEYYTTIRAWIPKHPNFSAYTNRFVDLEKGEQSCPICRAVITESALSGRRYRTPLGYEYNAFRCKTCGSTGRMSQRISNQSIPVQRAG